MVWERDRRGGVSRSVDWWTAGLYLALVVIGWLSVYGATHSVEQTEVIDMASRSGMQIVWIGSAMVIALTILIIDDSVYDTFAHIIYAAVMLLLIATIFNPTEIKGSHSWLVVGPLRLQPAEFAKFATALALAKCMSVYNFNVHRMKDLATALAVIMLPMVCIVLQNETGSALVYFAFFLVLYREGMTGSVLFTGVAAVIYFVVGVKYMDVPLWNTPTSTGEFVVLLLVMLFSIAMIWLYTGNRHLASRLLTICGGTTLVALLFAEYVIPFDITWISLALCGGIIITLIWQGVGTRLRNYFLIALFALGSTGFFYSTYYVLENVMQPHQRNRINVLLGLVTDTKDTGYNVHQSIIAIGSGGLTGKGFGNGTQNKLEFVPEQDTDFIFCTVGEEGGFIMASVVLLLFLVFILRLIHLAERQTHRFGRVYGYSVVAIFLFHIFINVGMVLGITPVIGIPLPFFSYGGSSLWGFTILLFIFLRIDAGRKRN